MPERIGPRGFTLIELLVVLAIIAILAAVMFPVLMEARAKGHTAKCLAHEKELYDALFMYTQDYSGKLPNGCFLNYSVPAQGCLTGRFVPYVKNIYILICQKAGSYGYNYLLYGDPGKDKAWVGELGPYVDCKNPMNTNGRRLDSIPGPHRVMAMICALPPSSIANDPANPGRAADALPQGWEWQPHDTGGIYARRMCNRHNGGTTYAFLDGHCKWLAPTGIKEGFPIATYGLDYDGNGTCGTENFMR